ncbi:MAG TPA: hypothetical protein VG479_08350 [Gaiellaceae bacterium]|nr:hypothetical protein [Gaiellaceae bacterium]
MSRRAQGLVGLAVLAAAAVVLIAVELSQGASSFGESKAADPCADRAPYPGSGFDATVQRIVLDGLDGAACELGTTREELVLAFDPALGADVQWDKETIERAVRSGLDEAIDDAEARGDIPGLAATLLREVVARAPIDWLIEGGAGIGGFLDELDLP